MKSVSSYNTFICKREFILVNFNSLLLKDDREWRTRERFIAFFFLHLKPHFNMKSVSSYNTFICKREFILVNFNRLFQTLSFSIVF